MAEKTVKKTVKKRKGQFDGKPGPGRPKGVRNKVPADLAKIVISVADSLDPKGLEAALKKWAEGAPGTFWTKMVAPLLPKTIEATLDVNQDIAGQFERDERAEKRAKENR